MSSEIFGDRLRDVDYSHTFRGRVVNNVDPKGEGRLGVFIPQLVTETPNSAQAPNPIVTILKATLFANQSDLVISKSVKTDNYIWCRPRTGLVQGGGANGAPQGGSYHVPTVGTMVAVEFEQRDPSKPYWLPHTPSIDGDVIGGSNIGKGINVQASATNWKDPKKRVNIHTMTEEPSGHTIYHDNNPNVNATVIHHGSGHTLTMHDGDKGSGFSLETARGHTFHMDEGSGEIRMKTQSGGVEFISKDDGTVVMKLKSSMLVQADGDITFNSKGNIAFDAQGNITATAKGNLTATAQGNLTATSQGGDATLAAPGGTAALKGSGASVLASTDASVVAAGDFNVFATGIVNVNSSRNTENPKWIP